MFVHLLFQKIHFCYDAAPFWSLCFALRSRMLYDRGKMLYSPRKHRLSVYFSILTLYISYRSKLTKSITSYRGRFHFEFQNIQQYSESKVSHIYFCFKNLLNCVLQCFYLFFSCNQYLDSFILFVQLDGLMNLKILYSTPFFCILTPCIYT